MNQADTEKGEIGRAGRVMAGGTLLSRILGLVRNQLLSHYFGAGFASDAFIAAFTIPNALRRLFGEGALTPAFVSIFTRELQKNDPRAAESFVSNCFWWLSLCVGFLCLLGILLSPWLVALYVPHFQEIEGKFELSVQLTRFLFPFLLFISWAALFMGVLNSLKSFAIPALGPAVLNLCVISLFPLAFWLLSADSELGIFVFSGAILVGVILQVVVFVPKLLQFRLWPRLQFNWRDPRVFSLGLILVPSLLSMGIYQLNIIVNRIFASDIPGAVSHLFYADLLIELPVSLIATSMSVAALPSLTRLYIAGDRTSLAQTFSFSTSLNLSLALPAMTGLILLATPLLSTIFYTGRFEMSDLEVSSHCLFFYSLGLPFFCLMRSLLPMYFAMKDTKTPAWIALFALFVNAVLAWYLSKRMGAPGIALATSASSFANCGLLCIILMKRFPDFLWGEILKTAFIASVFSLIMAVCLWQAQEVLEWTAVFNQKGIRLDKFVLVLTLVGLGAAVYLSQIFVFPQQALARFLRRRPQN